MNIVTLYLMTLVNSRDRQLIEDSVAQRGSIQTRVGGYKSEKPKREPLLTLAK